MAKKKTKAVQVEIHCSDCERDFIAVFSSGKVKRIVPCTNCGVAIFTSGKRVPKNFCVGCSRPYVSADSKDCTYCGRPKSEGSVVRWINNRISGYGKARVK